MSKTKREQLEELQATAVSCCRALTVVVGLLRSGQTSVENAMDDVEDIADIWAAQFDTSEPYDPAAGGKP